MVYRGGMRNVFGNALLLRRFGLHVAVARDADGVVGWEKRMCCWGLCVAFLWGWFDVICSVGGWLIGFGIASDSLKFIHFPPLIVRKFCNEKWFERTKGARGMSNI